MKQNITQILILFTFFILVSIFFIIYNEKLYHQKIGLKNFDDIGSSTLFSVIDKNANKIDISESNLEFDLISIHNSKTLFSDILRSLQSNKIHRYEFSVYKKLNDEDFGYLEKILNNLELEGAYFLNPDQLSDVLVNLYANDTKKANKLFLEFFTFVTFKAIDANLEEQNKLGIYKNKILQRFFDKYSSKIEINKLKILVNNFIYNENEILKSELSDFVDKEEIKVLEKFDSQVINYFDNQSEDNYYLMLDFIEKNKIKNLINKLIDRTKNDRGIYTLIERRVEYGNHIIKLIDYFSTKELKYFHSLKSKLIRNNIINNDFQKMIDTYGLKISDEEILKIITKILKENQNLKRNYNKNLQNNPKILIQGNIKYSEIFSQIKLDRENIEKYFLGKLTTFEDKFNLIYIISIILFSLTSSIIIVGVTFSFKKRE